MTHTPKLQNFTFNAFISHAQSELHVAQIRKRKLRDLALPPGALERYCVVKPAAAEGDEPPAPGSFEM